MAKSKPKPVNTEENKPKLNIMMEIAMQNETFRKLYQGPDPDTDNIIISIIPKAKPQKEVKEEVLSPQKEKVIADIMKNRGVTREVAIAILSQPM